MRVALLVIDLQTDFFALRPELAAQRAALVSATNALTTALRDAGAPIIWVRQAFRADLADAPLDVRRRGSGVTIAGTDGAHLLPELTRAAHDHEVIKTRFSAFHGTTLDGLLASLDVQRLVIAGINTHACVRMTAIDAYQRDWDVTLASECIGSYDAEHHAVTMRYLTGAIARAATNAEIIGDGSHMLGTSGEDHV